MTCAEFKESVAALALGALDRDECAACEAHLERPGPHDGCHAELARARETAALLGAAEPPVRPSAALWERIAAEVAAPARESGPRDPAAAAGERAGSRAPRATRRDAPAAGRAPRWREMSAWGLAAAAAAAAFVLGVERRNVERRLGEAERDIALAGDAERDKRTCLDQLASARIELRQKAAAIALLSAPETQLVQLAAQGGVPYRGSALVNRRVPNAMVLATALERQAGKDYQLWVIRGQDKIPAGILHADAAGTALTPIPQELVARGADAFAITVEPEGGAPQPTGPIVLVGALPAT